jgi:hypothetical protein
MAATKAIERLINHTLPNLACTVSATLYGGPYWPIPGPSRAALSKLPAFRYNPGAGGTCGRLPERIVDRGDPYLEEIEATVSGVTERLGRSIDHVIAYQSRAGPVKWVGPDVRDVVAEAPAEGRTWLGVVPISFVSEHVETLHELDIELRQRAADVGISEFHRSRCLDVDPVVGPMLADIVEEYL